MRKILKIQILFFGFYNKQEVIFDVDITNIIPTNINLALIEIKNGYLFERNMMQQIDWTLVKEFKKFRNEFRNYAKSNDKKLEDIKSELEMMKTEIKKLSDQMNNILNLIAPKKKKDESNYNIIGKKIKRKKK